MQKVLVVGLGEIGRPLFELIKESGRFQVYGFDVDKTKMLKLGQVAEEIPQRVDVIHICIPCASQEEFVKVVADYANKYHPRLLIINSTVPPKTTFKVSEKCKCLVSHSPIFGTHKDVEYMKWEIRRWTKIVGGVDAASSEATCKHFREVGIKSTALKGPLETELTKLLETIYSAWMITFFQEAHRISKSFGADLDEIVGIIGEIHRLRLDRPIWYPGVIGGHCLIPNTELLLKAYDSEFLRLILESNEKRKKEIVDESVRDEVEKIRGRVEAFQRELMEKWEKATKQKQFKK